MTHNQQIDLEAIFSQAQTNLKARCKLLQIGRKEGFSNTINRRFIWPFLLGLNAKEIKEKPIFQWKKYDGKVCLEYKQIKKDTDRAFSFLQGFQQVSKFHIDKRHEALLETLNVIFLQNDRLNYLQGFHEIASVFLVIFDENMAYYLIKTVSQTYYYDFLTLQFEEVAYNLSNMVYQLLIAQDWEFKKMLQYFQNKRMLVFVFPWLLTWFVHAFSSLKSISRVWDYILSTGPQAIIYLSAGLILTKVKELKAFCEHSQEAQIHQFFQVQAKKGGFNVQQAISFAIHLEDKFQLEKMKGFNKFNPRSKFRMENFYKTLPIHEPFHQKRKAQIKKYKTLSTVATVGGVALVIAAAYFAKKQGHFRLRQ